MKLKIILYLTMVIVFLPVAYILNYFVFCFNGGLFK